MNRKMAMTLSKNFDDQINGEFYKFLGVWHGVRYFNCECFDILSAREMPTERTRLVVITMFTTFLQTSYSSRFSSFCTFTQRRWSTKQKAQCFPQNILSN